MAKVIICDIQNCGCVFEGGPFNDYTKSNERWSMAIRLKGKADRCGTCSRKLFAKIAHFAWDELTDKPETKVETLEGLRPDMIKRLERCVSSLKAIRVWADFEEGCELRPEVVVNLIDRTLEEVEEDFVPGRILMKKGHWRGTTEEAG